MNQNSKFILFPCTLFNDTASNLDYIASNDWMMVNWGEKNVEGSRYDPI
jgi:hypothetical protein